MIAVQTAEQARIEMLERRLDELSRLASMLAAIDVKVDIVMADRVASMQATQGLREEVTKLTGSLSSVKTIGDSVEALELRLVSLELTRSEAKGWLGAGKAIWVMLGAGIGVCAAWLLKLLVGKGS